MNILPTNTSHQPFCFVLFPSLAMLLLLITLYCDFHFISSMFNFAWFIDLLVFKWPPNVSRNFWYFIHKIFFAHSIIVGLMDDYLYYLFLSFLKRRKWMNSNVGLTIKLVLYRIKTKLWTIKYRSKSSEKWKIFEMYNPFLGTRQKNMIRVITHTHILFFFA